MKKRYLLASFVFAVLGMACLASLPIAANAASAPIEEPEVCVSEEQL